MGQHFSPKTSATGLLSSQMLLKEEGLLHSGKHGSVTIYLRFAEFELYLFIYLFNLLVLPIIRTSWNWNYNSN